MEIILLVIRTNINVKGKKISIIGKLQTRSKIIERLSNNDYDIYNLFFTQLCKSFPHMNFKIKSINKTE